MIRMRVIKNIMIDISAWEVGLVLAVGLLVMGPKQLTHGAKQVGRWCGRWRRLWKKWQDELDNDKNP